MRARAIPRRSSPLSAPAAGGVAATATATLGTGTAAGTITAITLTGGSGYTTAPTITITDPTGTGAAASVAFTAGTATSDNFTYMANGNPTVTATVTLGAATIESASGISVAPITYTSTVATALSIASPGVLSVDSDGAGYPLTVAPGSVVAGTGLTLVVDPDGAFHANVPGPGTYSFTYNAQNSQGTVSTSPATVTLVFPTPSNLQVNVVDGKDQATPITDYRWIIEEDRTFFVDPGCTSNPPPATSTVTGLPAPMPVPASCRPLAQIFTPAI